MRPLMCLVALVLGAGCAGEPARTAPWREPGLLHEKPSVPTPTDTDNELLKNSQPLPAATGTPTTQQNPAPGVGAGQNLPSSGYWQ
jgi:hypothetical protein